MKKLWYVCMLLTLCLTGCNKTDDLWDDVNDLKTRVTALEKTVQDLNWNIEAVRELCKEGATITNIELKDGIYTITLSNGKTLKLVEETGAGALIPQMGIDNDGYWTVSYDNGVTFTQLKDKSGNPIKATAENGKTPLFRIDAETGYWQVSYDDSTYENVKDSAGNPVKATDGEAVKDKFFNSVEKVGNNFNIELRDGTKLSIPIISNFYCKFDESIVGVQRIAAGSTKDFIVHMKGVESYIITAPEGWEATLSEPSGDNDEGILTIKAPATTKTLSRAVADNTKDVSILATSGAYAAIAKIQVELGEAETRIDYYTLYNNGQDIEIGDLKVNKNDYGTPILYKAADMTEELNLMNDISQKAGAKVLLFLENGEYNFIVDKIAKINAEIVIIGRYSDSKPTLQPKLCWNLISGKLIFKNLHIDMSQINGASNATYLFNNASATESFNNLSIEDCEITEMQKNLFVTSSGSLTFGINTIHLKNNRFLLDAPAKTGDTDTSIVLFNLGRTSNMDAFQKLTMDNNLIYNAIAIKGQIFGWTNGTAQSPDQQSMKVLLQNNTIINLVGVNYHLKVYDAQSITIKKNAFYGDPSSAFSSNLCAVYKAGSNPTFDVQENIAFGLAGSGKWISFPSASTSRPSNPTTDQLTYLTENPFNATDFSTGDYSLKAPYTDYGMQNK